MPGGGGASACGRVWPGPGGIGCGAAAGTGAGGDGGGGPAGAFTTGLESGSLTSSDEIARSTGTFRKRASSSKRASQDSDAAAMSRS